MNVAEDHVDEVVRGSGHDDTATTPTVPALVMCGGKGERLDSEQEKPLYPIAGEPMIDRVLAALAESQADPIFGVVSPATPDTRAHLQTTNCTVIDGDGDGFVADLEAALDTVGRPALVVGADLPLLAPANLNRVLAVYGRRGTSVTVGVPAIIKRRLGASLAEETVREGKAPAGINIVTTTADTMYTTYDARLAVNVNRTADAELATAVLDSMEGAE